LRRPPSAAVKASALGSVTAGVSSASLLVCMSCVCVCVWVRGLCEVRSFHTSARSDRHARYLWSTPAAFRLRNKDGSVSTSACFHSLSLSFPPPRLHQLRCAGSRATPLTVLFLVPRWCSAGSASVITAIHQGVYSIALMATINGNHLRPPASALNPPPAGPVSYTWVARSRSESTSQFTASALNKRPSSSSSSSTAGSVAPRQPAVCAGRGRLYFTPTVS